MRIPTTWSLTSFSPAAMMMQAVDSPLVSDDVDARERLSSLRGLHVLSMLMFQQGDADQIVHLATTAIPALARATCEGILLQGSWHEPSPPPDPAVSEAIEAQL